MKRTILLLLLSSFFAFSTFAQTGEVKKDKVKKTSTVGQKVHNTFSKHKHYKGVKEKTKVDKPSQQ